ncbi:hypothetical protein UFOVP853_3 [uncultured Caudovirales phage]|uniref:Uncharacterized protein n=1 Tax=uncultured Caudovirales phage TaxID=2100421 RepID=A0A6J5P3D0_9CAUD|nr:hypothetical protein UFOVP853_3 [uncultured Caudovirales phage]
MTEADRLREQCDQIMRLRHTLIAWEARAQSHGIRSLAAKCEELESWLLNIEDEIAACADRLDPPPMRVTGQQWIAGLTRRAAQ